VLTEDEYDGEYEGTREEVQRAIQRLNALEYLIIAVVVLFALAGGGLVAFILSSGTRLPFRLTWGILSTLLLVVPGLFVFGRDRLPGKAGRSESDDSNQGDG
jgi:hypothetical protein